MFQTKKSMESAFMKLVIGLILDLGTNYLRLAGTGCGWHRWNGDGSSGMHIRSLWWSGYTQRIHRLGLRVPRTSPCACPCAFSHAVWLLGIITLHTYCMLTSYYEFFILTLKYFVWNENLHKRERERSWTNPPQKSSYTVCTVHQQCQILLWVIYYSEVYFQH